jgi:hypothetical protein
MDPSSRTDTAGKAISRLAIVRVNTLARRRM